MKGLVLTHMGRRDEGIELVKKGMRLDLTSHICWHVFGLIQKAEKNYDEALKSFTMALKFDKVSGSASHQLERSLMCKFVTQDNQNLLRDAASLQIQLRVFDGLVDSRHNLTRLRPNLRSNWIGLAVAYHLNGDLAEAKRVMEHYFRILKVWYHCRHFASDADPIRRTFQISISSNPSPCFTL
jgi:peptide alpha-N-acetyltransferase